ncbi:IS1595 family transposase [Hydrogenophaga flava]|uniref:IS1595 family transposase n=1 Tax=Hydrogenophaga flava TaxID=65657 RepID=UPI000825F752|nr:IS1595 family transposase [Hydrogenophaga flava]
MSYLSQPHFHNEEAAYAFVESRVWPNGPVCPHCGGTERNKLMGGASTRIGTYKCYDCRKPFTVKVGTIFESSHIPLRLWLQGIYLIAASKKGISANQLHRTLGITLKSAWFMGHRIREAMRDNRTDLLGGGGSIVEADETYMASKRGEKAIQGGGHRSKVLSLVSREGRTRSFHVANVDKDNLKPILLAHIAKDTHLMTDGAGHYKKIGQEFDLHESTNHTQKEYAKDSKVKGVRTHSNTVESYFGILKRGISGIYHHVSEEHLQRYVDEFDFRFTNRKSMGVDDVQRADLLLKGVVGKRLTYETIAQ